MTPKLVGRCPLYIFFGIATVPAILGFAVFLGVADYRDLPGSVGTAVVIGGIGGLIVATAWTRVECYDTSLVLVNMYFRYTIPMAAVARLRTYSGIRFELKDGKAIMSTAYSGSLTLIATGNWRSKWFADKLWPLIEPVATSADADQPGDPVSRRLRRSVGAFMVGGAVVTSGLVLILHFTAH